MNIFNKVTTRSLSKNRTRTVVTIIGVILSAAMITGVTTFASSLQHFMAENAKEAAGDWYGTAAQMSRQETQELKGQENVAQVGAYENVGYSVLKEKKDESKPYLFLAGYSKELEKLAPVKLVSGRMPAGKDEIVIPEHLGSSYKEGDKIKLKVGELTSGGELLDQNRELTGSEKITNAKEKTYRVVGICERPTLEPYRAPGYMAITAPSENKDASFQTYFKTDKPKQVYAVSKRVLEDKSVIYNDELLTFLGASDNRGINGVLAGFSGIVIGLIMLGSISLIYNAFSISVGERTRQFGLLSSIGATKKQLRKSVLWEALMISIIGIPLGILAGIGGIGVTLHFVDRLIGTAMESGSVQFTLWLSPAFILAAAVIALITVLISAWVPSQRASRLSAIDAVKQTKDVKLSAKKVKTGKLAFQIFGLEGMLAKKNFKRNKKRYRATVISLFMSVVLFISASAFTLYLTSGVEDAYGAQDDYDIMYYGAKDKDPNKLYDSLSQVSGVTDSVKIGAETFRFQAQKENFSEKDWKKLEQADKTEKGTAYLDAVVLSLDNKSFKEYVTSQGLPLDRFTSKIKPQLIACKTMILYDADEQKVKKVDLFDGERDDALNLEYEAYDKDGNVVKSKNYSAEIGGTAKEAPMGYGGFTEGPVLITSEDMAKTIFGEGPAFRDGAKSTLQVSMYFKVDQVKKTYSQMEQVCTKSGGMKSGLSNIAQEKETTRNMLIVVKIFSYGFTILISLIAMANVFNTISTSIMLRKREFAMLESVGMSRRSFKKMMNYECILYGVKALVFGIPAAILVTVLLYFSLMQGVETSFMLPWSSIGISILSVFLVVFATMLYATRKIKNENTVEALKNENL